MKKMILLLMAGLMVAPAAQAQEKSQPRVYSLVVDRFLNGTEKNNAHIHNNDDDQLPYGGDFQGIESKLDYIKDMGFNVIHISPIFKHEQNDYLGYKVTSYDKIDDVYGGDQHFKELIKKIHEKKMKIVVDMPVVATNDFTAVKTPVMNDIQKEYYGDTKIIDLKNAANQQKYKAKMAAFVKDYQVDGLSMYTLQDGIDADKVMPDLPMNMAILNKDMTAENFDYVQKEETTLKLANGFKKTDQPLPDSFAQNELLAADNFFMPRFTKYAADENMFPGTRIKLLLSYLLSQKQPMSMTYGTEIAMNGGKMPEMHQLLDFRTEKEVTDYLKATSGVFDKYREMFEGKMQVLMNKAGHQVIHYDTGKVDFIYNLNNTDKATKVELGTDVVPKGKMLSGLLIGDSIHEKEGKFELITNREEAELYAIIDDRGLNIGYIIASIGVVVAFTLFIILAARKPKRNR
ncbi:alpha-amylase family glycosyl hydrolase [Macrococcus brunensis]|uniref:alpha-amylase family glycosyl hydrolase n=1 Tax=Macrococcus brunensis TaxID=198483 RepID=UPI001EF103E0|nr:alpha-amylase family glycosyl hydrolase [Macrococcus brunensis]ULG74885.1 alpha-amylase family glycosyl hydrolase [Macrococcus brunensis]